MTAINTVQGLKIYWRCPKCKAPQWVTGWKTRADWYCEGRDNRGYHITDCKGYFLIAEWQQFNQQKCRYQLV